MTRSGWTGRRRWCWRSWRAGCWPTRSRWWSPRVSRVEEFRGLPELLVGGLGEGDARALLGSVIPGPLDERVRDRIVAETRGNPLALLELPRGMPGMPGLSALPGVPGRVEESFRGRLEVLPAATQRLMLVAAAEQPGSPRWCGGRRSGSGSAPGRPQPAANAGLLVIGERVTFRHPLVRSAVYRAASPAERRAVHQALAGATDPQADPDRWAWHRAQAAPGPDEDVRRSWSARRAGPRRAAGWPQRPRSWSGRPR